MLLVPLQYFPGIVCFLSETLVTKSTVCLNGTGHISIFLLLGPSRLAASSGLSETRHVRWGFHALRRVDLLETSTKEKVLTNRGTLLQCSLNSPTSCLQFKLLNDTI